MSLNPKPWAARRRCLWLLCVCLWLLMFSSASSAEEYSFDLEEFEKKSLEWGGYVEAKGEHLDGNQQGAFSLLNSPETTRASLDRLSSTLQLDGSYDKEITSLHWVLQATGSWDEAESSDSLKLFEGYASIKPNPSLSIDVGKKVFKWGKGYAWNPVAFIDRAKDPNNPEDAMEGYVGAALDLVKSFEGAFQTVAFTAVALPVWEDVNSEFGKETDVALAAKLYLLVMDTDVDFLFYTDTDQSVRYGIDLSRNLSTNFEIHGEVAHTPKQKSKVLDSGGTLVSREIRDTSYLIGLRYLTESDVTSIVEFYHNDDGYTKSEMERFYQLVDERYEDFLSSGSNTRLQQAVAISKAGYGKPQAGRDYLFARITQKDPFDILYVTPGITAIVNLDDQSFSLSPEVVYTGFTNWELRLRVSHLHGSKGTEFGEKQNQNKMEMRVRYYF